MKSRIVSFWIAGTLLTGFSPDLPYAEAQISKDVVVKVFVTSNQMDPYRPWQSSGSSSATGSGCVLPGKRILTNAHVVADSTFIQVRKESDPRKFTARVSAIGHDCDLAILTVDDEAFFQGINPLETGELPDLQDTVTVLGYPTGGDKLSITEGVVSRVEIISYTQSSKKLLAVQIDAAINPGNSGGPVLQNGRLVGVAMQVRSNSENIGYMIPPPIINHFLDDLKDGEYSGFPTLGIDFHGTENKTLRKYYAIDEKGGGVLISKVLPYSAAETHIQEGDIVLKVDGIPVGVDGTFEFRQSERLDLSYLINRKQIGESIDMEISRAGKVQKLQVPLIPFVALVPHPHYFQKPPYYIYGGLVFTVLSSDLLAAWGGQWWEKAPLDFLYYLIGTGRLNEKKRHELVVLLDVLPDDINVGYHAYSNEVIRAVNGTEVTSFKQFVALLEESKAPYITFETEQRRRIILGTEDIDTINQAILGRNHIPSLYSEDVGEWITQTSSKSP